MAANITMEGVCMIIISLLIFCTISDWNRRDRQTEILLMMLILHLLMLMMDASSWMMEGKPQYLLAQNVVNYALYILSYLMTMLLGAYVVGFVKERRRIHVYYMRLVVGLGCLYILAVVVAMFNHMYFTYNELGYYIRGPLYAVSQTYTPIVFTLALLMIIRSRKELGAHTVRSLISYEVLPNLATLIQVHHFGLSLTLAATSLSLLILYLGIHLRQTRQLREKELEVMQMNISIMLSQIQPHFMFNALSAIQTLCEVNPEQAGQVVGNFAVFLRGSIDSLSSMEMIPFEKELEHTRSYLEIEKVRFGRRLEVVYCIESSDFMIPTLTLEPVVENAVRYGVTKKVHGGTVWITVKRDGDWNRIIVRDDGAGFDPSVRKHDGRSHVGLDNVRSRLKVQCNGTLDIVSEVGAGTTVTISLPVIR